MLNQVIEQQISKDNFRDQFLSAAIIERFGEKEIAIIRITNQGLLKI